VSSKIWFILNEGQVTGPYDADEVEQTISQGAGKSLQVWGKGQNEWMEPAKWRQAFKQSLTQAQADAAAAEEKPSWYVSVDGHEYPPLSYKQLIQYLKTLKSLAAVDLKTESEKVWRDVYSFQRIVNDLGITRRAHPRVPIMGTLQCEGSNGNFTARALSISEGGLGMSQTANLQIGDKLRLVLTSPNLHGTVTAHCDVVYIGNDGYAGLRFKSLTEENKSLILEYVNKFATV